jgi:hypothetical protein
MKKVITMLHTMVPNNSPIRTGTKRNKPTHILFALATAADVTNEARTANTKRAHNIPCGKAEGYRV